MDHLPASKKKPRTWGKQGDELDVSYVIVGFRNDVPSLESLARFLYEKTKNEVSGCEVILVMNDNSSIATSEGLRVVQGQGNVGFAEGVRIGVEEAQGSYVIIVNPDCAISEVNLRRFLDQRSNHASVRTPILKNDDGGIDFTHYENWIFTPGRKLSEFICKYYVLKSKRSDIPRMVKIPGTFIGLPRKLAIDLGGPFDCSYFLYGEDRDLTNRLRNRKIPMVLMRDVVVQHTGGQSGTTVSALVEKCKSDSSLRVAYRRFGRLGTVLEAFDLLIVGCFKDSLRGGDLLPARAWAVRRWFRAGLREPGRLSEPLLGSE